MRYWLWVVCILFSVNSLNSAEHLFSALEEIPVAYKGRFRPFKAFAKLWADETYSHVNPEEFLWISHFKGDNLREDLLMLPSKQKSGEWLSLQILKNPEAINKTAYKNETFQSIQKSYQKLSQAIQKGQISDLEIKELSSAFANQMITAYSEIAGREIIKGKLTYPTRSQLYLELIYIKYPWTLLLLSFYGTSLLFFAWERFSKKENYKKIATAFFYLAFLLHTSILAVRCYILERPPVSNMYETVIYVPWIAVLLGSILYMTNKKKNSLPLIGSALFSFILLFILYCANLDHSLENVQAVLNSQYWLTVHVLMVVGSYGAFGVAGILGHAYILMKNFNYKENSEQAIPFLVQSLYLGVAMLTIGTILGGVWAAQSWGRFWDWDPKESWAFISISIYLLIIHAYRFNKIGSLGLAFGAIAGFLSISFTWYGVNYILGTGLHSYGFGQGRDLYYWLYFLAEIAFISAFSLPIGWSKGKINGTG